MATEAVGTGSLDGLDHPKPDEIEIASGRQREHLEDSIPSMATEDDVRDALEKAFDYRGDISLTLRDGTKVDGYLFDRCQGKDLASSFIRVISSRDKVKRRISYAEIGSLVFSGRDTAAGRTFEAWVKKYWEKKASGETNIQIEPEILD